MQMQHIIQSAKQLDEQVFSWLNYTLLDSPFWQAFWGYLNHPHETWLNVVVMACLNILAIFMLPKPQRKRATILVIYFWAFFEIALLATNKIFTGLLAIHRDSPSIVVQPWVVLSETLNIPSIKVYSHNSFPAGHTFVAVFWALFTNLYTQKKWFKYLIILTVLLLILPRLFSGAHWLSDVIFTIFYALLWFGLAKIIWNKLCKKYL